MEKKNRTTYRYTKMATEVIAKDIENEVRSKYEVYGQAIASYMFPQVHKDIE